MELRHLRYFTAVFEERSVSRAAERLLLSQPALTRQIHALEREIGTPLFERVPAGVLSTAAGSALYSHAQTVLRLADTCREIARSAGAIGERVDVGLPPGLPPQWLTDALSRISAHVPQAQVAFTDAGSAEQLRMVREGSLDIALVHQNPPETLTAALLFEQPFGVAVRPEHPLAGSPTCRLRHLHDVGVLAHARDQVPAEHDRMIAAAHHAGVTPRWHFARFTENALACANAAGADAALLTEPSAARLLPDWPWSRLVEPEVALRTWAVRQPITRSVVTASMETIAGTGSTQTHLRRRAAEPGAEQPAEMRL
jgi:DNA-binding transcriptional LysR family regulator